MEKYVLRFKNPVWWGLFVALAIGLVSAFPKLGEDGVMWVLIGTGAAVILLSILWDALRQGYKRMMAGEPTKLDWGVAPSGYRRNRRVETPEEEAALSVVIPTPNRPLYVDADADTERLDPQALVRATDTRIERYGESSGRILHLADGCNPPIDLVIGRAVLFLGMRGSGKTNGLARFLEQMFRFPIPALIGDYEEDYLSLPEISERCLIAGSPDWAGQYRLPRYWKVTAGSAREFGYSILEYGVQVVLQIGSYATLEEAAAIMTGAIRGMFAWAEEQRPDARVPALIGLDEAQHFLPQDSSVSNIAPAQANELLKAFMDVNARGRKRGLTPVIATQRPAQIKKAVITGSEIYFLMKQTNARDLEAYEELLGRGAVDRRVIASFQRGECLVYESGECFSIRFHERESEHRGKTPTLTQALRRYGNGQAAPARIDFSYRDTEEYAELEPEDGEFEQQEPEIKPAVPVTKEPSLLERGVNAYLDGATKQPELAAALSISLWEARKLMPQIQAEVKKMEVPQA